MARISNDLPTLLKQHSSLSFSQELAFVWRLSIPGILAQITQIAMMYIDASMVGNLGASASASIGLVGSTTWLFGGLSMAFCYGFSVQVAHAVGAGENDKARSVFKQGIAVNLMISLLVMLVALSICFHLPLWLGGGAEIVRGARQYFGIFAVSIPINQMGFLMCNMLQCSGNMKVPSFLDALMCLLDVAFNYLFIKICGWGVAGASLGTLCSQLVVLVAAVYFAVVRSKVIGLRGSAKLKISMLTLREAARISVPMALEQVALCGAQVVSTRIVAPLGTVALAANSFGITAESLCYMPGYGMSSAATTLVGQSLGAKRKTLARQFAWVTVGMGMLTMGVMGVLMYFSCPAVFAFLTPDGDVRSLGVEVLRIELLAEPLFGASIVANGALRGAGDTLFPGMMNLVSMWGVRLVLAFFLSCSMGLKGVWIAMCAELCFRGVMFLIRLGRERWLKRF